MLSCIFQAIGNILLQKVQNHDDSSTGKERADMELDLFSPLTCLEIEALPSFSTSVSAFVK